MDVGEWAREVDIDQPSAARMYDYYLGGSHNFASDREAAEQVIRAIPNVRQIAVANRAFVRNAVRHLLDLGVRQFLDIGSGLPTVGSVHEIAQVVDPRARVVYVDIDPVAIVHAGHLLAGNERAVAIVADLRHPEAILSHRQVRETLDLTQPVGLLLVSMLHFLPDADAYPAVAHLRSILAAGSGLVISHVAAEGMARQNSDAAAVVYQRSTAPGGAVLPQPRWSGRNCGGRFVSLDAAKSVPMRRAGSARGHWRRPGPPHRLNLQQPSTCRWSLDHRQRDLGEIRVQDLPAGSVREGNIGVLAVAGDARREVAAPAIQVVVGVTRGR